MFLLANDIEATALSLEKASLSDAVANVCPSEESDTDDDTATVQGDTAEALVPDLTESAPKGKTLYGSPSPSKKLDVEGLSHSVVSTDRFTTPGSNSQKSRFQTQEFVLTTEDKQLVEKLVGMGIYGGDASELEEFMIRNRIRLSHFKEGGLHNQLTASPRKYWVLFPNGKGNGFNGHPNVMIWERYVGKLEKSKAKTCKVYDLECREFVSDEKVSAILRGYQGS
jgi:hypothetical protein